MMEIAEAIPVKKVLAISSVIRITLDIREIFLSLGGAALALSLIRFTFDRPPEILVITGLCSVLLLIKRININERTYQQNYPDESGFLRIELGNVRERGWNSLIKGALSLLVPDKSDLKTHVHLNLVDVDCSNVRYNTPYVILNFLIENYLPYPLYLETVAESGGSIGGRWLDADLNLPALPQVLNVPVRKYSRKEFEIRLDIHSPELKECLLNAEAYPRSVRWRIWGRWYAEVRGSRQIVWDNPTTLSCDSVPLINDQP